MRTASLRDKIFQRTVILKFIICLLVIFLFPWEGFSANFSITPVRIFFEGSKRTDILTIKNESSKKVALQISAVAWTQDEKGQDVYSPTEDILFFPKLVEIIPEEEKILRIGKKISRSDAEKTYRLFIEEIPDESGTETTSVKILMKVGVPIFISPPEAAASGVIEEMEFHKGSLRMNVKNEGNVHFIIRTMKIVCQDRLGKEVYATERAGGYLHHGKSKEFTFEIPQDACRKMKTINAHINTDKLTMGNQIEIVEEVCNP